MADTVHPLPPGTRIRHVGQEWARTATATVLDWTGPYADGSYEYRVRARVDISCRTGPHNPETRETRWSSLSVRTAT